MQQLPPLIISGSIAIDRIMNFNGHYPELIQPDKLHSLSVSIFLDELHDTPGGVGANIAYTLALLGDKPVLLGSVGKDAAGYIDTLTQLGVDTTHVHTSSLPTASFNVITDGANRQVGGFYPGAMFDSATLTLDPWLDANPLVVVSPHDPKAMRAQVEQCRLHNLRLFYDVGQQATNIDGQDIRAGVEAAELLIANDYEIALIAKKSGMTETEIKSKVPVVITTLGEDGSRIEGKAITTPITVPAVKPAQVADPTGAGDAYRGGFLHGYIRGWDITACAELGAVCGTYAVENHGTQAHAFTFAEAAQRYEQNFNKQLPQ